MPRPRISRPARRAVATLACAAVGLVVLPSAPARAVPDKGIDTTALSLRWFDATNAAVQKAGQPEQSTQNRTWAISWLAAARAVQQRGNTAFQVAALAQSLHDTLQVLSPTQQAALDQLLKDSLASVPDGAQERAGVEAGKREAARSLAERDGDGLATREQVDPPYSPPAPDLGIWRQTPGGTSSVRFGLPTARAYLLTRNDQFRVGPPPGLDDPTYLAALKEVHDYGAATGSLRSDEQTQVADFVSLASIDTYVQVLRAVVAQEHQGLRWTTRLLAVFNTVQLDQQIAVYDSKFTYVRWRPVTAIREGGEGTWLPRLNTPSHPEYPSGHTGYAGTAEVVLTALVGQAPKAPIDLTAKGITRTYSSWSALTQDTIDGRVWEGVHFRFSDVTGAEVVKRVARYDLTQLERLGLSTDD